MVQMEGSQMGAYGTAASLAWLKSRKTTRKLVLQCSLASLLLKLKEVVDVDPKKFISKNGIIAYEKEEGFQVMTNFDFKITGFVGQKLQGSFWLLS